MSIRKQKLGPAIGKTPSPSAFKKALEKFHQDTVELIRTQRKELFKHNR